MRVLFDVTHPANVHLFRHVIANLRSNGHDTLVCSRDKDVTVELLDHFGIDHTPLTRKANSLPGMAGEWVVRTARLLTEARRFAPHVLVAAEAGVSIGPVGALLSVPRVVFAQVDRAAIQNALGLPWASVICTGSGYRGPRCRRQERFNGFQTQAYLDPSRFVPDPEPLRKAGIDPHEPYVVLRLVRWSATHDVGRKAPALPQVLDAVESLRPHARVVITAEGPLPDALASWGNPVPPAAMHDLLAFADVCIAEGGTVPVEAALLGVPSVACNTYRFGYIAALVKRRLLTIAESLPAAAQAARRILSDTGARARQQQRAADLRASTDDVLNVMLTVIANAAGRRSAS